MAKLKTKVTTQNVMDFLNKVEPEQKRKDSFKILKMMQEITDEKPVMWGPSIVGFGKYHYKYDSGHEGDMCITGFSPRKNALTIYVYPDKFPELLINLGKHKTSKACLYIKRLQDVDSDILKEIIKNSVQEVKKTNDIARI